MVDPSQANVGETGHEGSDVEIDVLPRQHRLVERPETQQHVATPDGARDLPGIVEGEEPVKVSFERVCRERPIRPEISLLAFEHRPTTEREVEDRVGSHRGDAAGEADWSEQVV